MTWLASLAGIDRFATPYWLGVGAALAFIMLSLGPTWSRLWALRLDWPATPQPVKPRPDWRTWPLRLLHTTSVLCFAVALARPQQVLGPLPQPSLGHDIMVVIDTSESMNSPDYVEAGRMRSRIDVAKNVLAGFIAGRSGDRIGLTIFGTQAYAYTPLTTDHDVLLSLLKHIQAGMAGSATAIGDAIAIAAKRLQQSKAKTPIIVLMTDGANTAGQITPEQASEAARALGIRIYTIALGAGGDSDSIFSWHGESNVDTTLLTRIAAQTGGRFFAATDAATLRQIYRTIDQLEKSEKKTASSLRVHELFENWVAAGAVLTLGRVLWQSSRWGTLL